jgi:hypothetical protein
MQSAFIAESNPSPEDGRGILLSNFSMRPETHIGLGTQADHNHKNHRIGTSKLTQREHNTGHKKVTKH